MNVKEINSCACFLFKWTNRQNNFYYFNLFSKRASNDTEGR